MDDLDGACRIEAISFDFKEKIAENVAPAGIRSALDSGAYLWIDVEVVDVERTLTALSGLDLGEAGSVLEPVIRADSASYYRRSKAWLQFVILGCRLEDRELSEERVDVLVTTHLVLTSRHTPALFLENMKESCRADFVEHATSPSFLIFELWDHVAANYVDVQERFEARVEALQTILVREVDEPIFRRVASLQGGILQMRKLLVPGRATIQELATRKSIHVSEDSRPYLTALATTIERVLQDMMADRDILAGTLDLHMTMVNHRTNEVVKRLTSVSIIFLPLTFLCGVWGMNFRHMPELRWFWGYGMFWVLVGALTVFQVIVLRRMKML